MEDKKEYEGFGYCEYHERFVDEGLYEFKGCWGCNYFYKGKEFPYIDVKEASKELGVSENTIIMWIKKGKLKGRLFVRGRRRLGFLLLSPPRKYHIEIKSVKELMKK